MVGTGIGELLCIRAALPLSCSGWVDQEKTR